jgi:hypothetical protein
MTVCFDALMIFKPDMVRGAYATCDRALARDTVRGMLAVYTGQERADYEVGTSAHAVRWGAANVHRKERARDWYRVELADRDVELRRLRALLTSPTLIGDGSVVTTGFALGLIDALGFTVARHHEHHCTYRDFLGLYGHNTHFTRLARDLRDYLVDRPVEILLLKGIQEITALHVMKELMRRVIRYPDTHYDAVENLLHVADPGARDWAYFETMLVGS